MQPKIILKGVKRKKEEKKFSKVREATKALSKCVKKLIIQLDQHPNI